MTIQAKIIADSISHAGKRITTFQLLYPRFIHSEVMTHRVFSRNASSSRAIPVKKMIQMIRDDPAMPIHWGLNAPGMQAHQEIQNVKHAKDLWIMAAHKAANYAEDMMNMGLHKQVANRILEPFQHISVVLTATEFDNWFELRAHPDAQPEIQELAHEMRHCMGQSTPRLLNTSEWHLPYITDKDRSAVLALGWSTDTLLKISAARCCRVSYLKHDGSASSVEEDLALCDRLAGAQPIHASPFEHQATPDTWVIKDDLDDSHWLQPYLHGNFVGWIQYRKLIEAEFK